MGSIIVIAMVAIFPDCPGRIPVEWSSKLKKRAFQRVVVL